MKRDLAWDIFKNTGNVDAYLLMKEMEQGNQLENNTLNTSLGDMVNGDSTNQRNSN